MREGINESPINPLPAVVWILALPVIASEVVFGLGRLGLIGGAEGAGLRLAGILISAFDAQLVQKGWNYGGFDLGQSYRFVSYPFVNASFMQASFVLAFTLTLGNMIARVFRPWAVVLLFFGSATGGALVYAIITQYLPGPTAPLIGGFPAIYGLIGAFTFLLWARLASANENRFRSFSLIGVLLLFQLTFGVIFGDIGYSWIAEVAAFGVGFGLSFYTR